MYDVVIIGGGPAGLSAAIYMARAKYKTLVLEKASYGGQITITERVVNYPGIMEVSGRELTYRMHMQGEGFGAEYAIERVIGIEEHGDTKIVVTDKRKIETIGVIVATGANPRKIGFPGEKEFAGRGIAYCATCDGEFFTGKDIFVVGGGFAACEEGVFLTRFARKVIMIVREPDFTCAKSIGDEVRVNPKIEIHFNSEVKEVGGDNFLKYAVFKNNETGHEFTYDAEDGDTFGMFIFAGYQPDTEVVKKLVEIDKNGYIITDADKNTNVKGICAAGDVCVKNLRQVVTATSDGAQAATTMEHYVSAMHEKLGIKRELHDKPHGLSAEENTKSSIEARESELKGLKYFDEEMMSAMQEIFSGYGDNKIILKLYCDNRDISREAEQFLMELEKVCPCFVFVKEDKTSPTGMYPFIGIYNQKEKYMGTGFHGIPGGHEFSSFVTTLKNVLEMDKAERNEQKIETPVKMKVIVSLSCHICPETVVAAQKIAIENDNIITEVYDLAHYPKFREEYGIMSVPCIVLNEEKIAFGKKDVHDLIGMIKELQK